jgi:tRNA nucleotidyltransferase (CCA-adding enzyme)
MKALRAALAVATHEIASAAQAKGFNGPKVGELIHDARVEAVAQAI